MSTRIFSPLLLLLFSLIGLLRAPGAMRAQGCQDHQDRHDVTAQLARIERHQSPDWLAIEPHLPNPATASAAQLEMTGDVLRARRFPEDAVEFYLAALNRGGQEAALMNKLGIAELELRNVPVARAYFRRVVQLERKNARAWNNLGAVEYSDGQLRSAISDYGHAIKLDAEQATYHSNRGTAYFDAKDYNRARREFDIALRLDPQLMDHVGTAGLEVHMLSPSDHGALSV